MEFFQGAAEDVGELLFAGVGGCQDHNVLGYSEGFAQELGEGGFQVLLQVDQLTAVLERYVAGQGEVDYVGFQLWQLHEIVV